MSLSEIRSVSIGICAVFAAVDQDTHSWEQVLRRLLGLDMAPDMRATGRSG